MWPWWLPAFVISIQRCCLFSDFTSKLLLRSQIFWETNRLGPVAGICITFTCFQTLRLRKHGFLHETGFSLPHPSIPLWWSKFFQMERAWISIILLEIEANVVIYIHSKFSNELGFLCRQPRPVMYAIEISLLQILVALQQQVYSGWQIHRVTSLNSSSAQIEVPLSFFCKIEPLSVF